MIIIPEISQDMLLDDRNKILTIFCMRSIVCLVEDFKHGDGDKDCYIMSETR